MSPELAYLAVGAVVGFLAACAVFVVALSIGVGDAARRGA